MDFFCFSTCSLIFHFIVFCLRPSGFGFNGFLLFFGLAASSPILLPLVKAVGFRF